ncbi:type VII secretion integral membrane protein EccD [Rugosimonospora africana]|uniref:type VII secretion integral membrane protein EccD n=1 Tax=Rugosimonospora africana TaxID=556532 RepID=UPI001EF2CB9E|nr:type VII secretion integral membrane protein EccD [Rugosimonospora africana]
MTTATGLAKLTVNTPQRRIDVALPEQAPLGELLPDLLRHAGIGLADEGQAHGGWALRRADGTALAVGAGLAAQGVRDGDVLYLGPGQAPWPELEYDDVVDAIAAGARGHGQVWDGAATRTTGLTAAALVLLLGAGALLGAPGHGALPGLVGLGAALLLTLGGIVASRAYADSAAGSVLAALALPYAFAGGLLVLAPGVPADRGTLTVAFGPDFAPRLLVASVAVVVVAAVAAVGIGDRLRIFVAGLAAGCLGVLGAGLGYRLSAGLAAAVVLAVLVIGAAAVPLLAMRLGNLPVPVLAPDQPERLDRARVHAAAVRADEILAGLLSGLAVAATVAAVSLAGSAGDAGRLLVAVAAAGFLVRARLFPAVRHRLPLLLAGAGTAGALLTRVPATLPVVAGALAVAVVCLAAGLRYRTRPPGPYLGRAADLLDALCVISVIPIACAVLGLYGAVRGLAG